nr:uncharacterized protein LOC112210492 [Halyomorpha halys]
MQEDEVLVALRNAKFGKAAGPGGISVELLDAEETRFPKALAKKEDSNECRNYRGICVRTSVSRVIARILNGKLEEKFVTPEEQFGFTAARSCMDSIFVLRQLIDRKTNRAVHIAFINLELTYDSVPRHNMGESLKSACISIALVNAVRSTDFESKE